MNWQLTQDQILALCEKGYAMGPDVDSCEPQHRHVVTREGETACGGGRLWGSWQLHPDMNPHFAEVTCPECVLLLDGMFK